MLIGIGGIQPGGAEVAEMRLAAEAPHVVAAVCFLTRRRAGWARRRIHLQVVQ